MAIEFIIETGDITAFATDVVILKYAQTFYGLDKAVAGQLSQAGVPASSLTPPPGDYRYLDTQGCLRAPKKLESTAGYRLTAGPRRMGHAGAIIEAPRLIAPRAIATAGSESELKPHIFVAMPFKKEMEMSSILAFSNRFVNLALFVSGWTRRLLSATSSTG